ncbi:MAG: hypothetical protein U0O47_01450 [Oscillospiraceae bacterium]|nr:hypothetical protein [Oscillospiraceae bacterium]
MRSSRPSSPATSAQNSHRGRSAGAASSRYRAMPAPAPSSIYSCGSPPPTWVSTHRVPSRHSRANSPSAAWVSPGLLRRSTRSRSYTSPPAAPRAAAAPRADSWAMT